MSRSQYGVFGEITGKTARCEWCGRFVPRDTKVTCWRVNVAEDRRQLPDSPYNIWARVLCPVCAAGATSGSFGHWVPVTFSEAFGRWKAIRDLWEAEHSGLVQSG